MKLYAPSILLSLLMIWKAHIHVVLAQEQDLPPLDLYCGDANCYDGKKSLYLGFIAYPSRDCIDISVI